MPARLSPRQQKPLQQTIAKRSRRRLRQDVPKRSRMRLQRHIAKRSRMNKNYRICSRKRLCTTYKGSRTRSFSHGHKNRGGAHSTVVEGQFLKFMSDFEQELTEFTLTLTNPDLIPEPEPEPGPSPTLSPASNFTYDTKYSGFASICKSKKGSYNVATLVAIVLFMLGLACVLGNIKKIIYIIRRCKDLDVSYSKHSNKPTSFNVQSKRQSKQTLYSKLSAKVQPYYESVTKGVSKTYGGYGIRSSMIYMMFRNLVPLMGVFTLLKILTSLSRLTPKMITQWELDHPKEVSDVENLLETSRERTTIQDSRTTSNLRRPTTAHLRRPTTAHLRRPTKAQNPHATQTRESSGSLLDHLQTVLHKLKSRHGRSLSTSKHAKLHTLKQAISQELNGRSSHDRLADMDYAYRHHKTLPIQINPSSASSHKKGAVYEVMIHDYHKTDYAPLYLTKQKFIQFRQKFISLGSACKAFITNTVDAAARIKSRTVRKVITDAFTRRSRSEPRQLRLARWLNALVVGIRKLMPLHHRAEERELHYRSSVDREMRKYLRHPYTRNSLMDCVRTFLKTPPQFLYAYASNATKYRRSSKSRLLQHG